MKNEKICHLSSAHSRYDVRIFQKQCKSLAQAGFDVSLIVADGKGDEVVDNVTIYDVGESKNRLGRMWSTTKKVYKKAQEVDADLYHFHDPELMPVGLRLKRKNKHVIYDVHEDLPRDILTKEWLHPWLRTAVSIPVEILEHFVAKRLSAVVVVTDFIAKRFEKVSEKCVVINNFPILEEFKDINTWEKRENEICYVGGISRERGIFPLLRSLENSDYTLNLAGGYLPKELRKELINEPGWKNVNEKGFVDRLAVKEILDRSKVGMLTVLPVPNSVGSQPNKLFEYMAAGIPTVLSNIPHWKEIVEKSNCGICVDCRNAKEISCAVEYLLANPEEAEQMGKNGRRAVYEIYNWSIEQEKLINLYKGIL